MALVISLILACTTWLLIGERVSASDHEEQNSMLNVLIYFLVALPISVVIVFFGFNL